MTRFGWLVVAGFIAALSIALLLWGFARQSFVPGLGDEPGETAVDPTTLSIYTSGTHGFSFMYPAAATLDDRFADEPPFPWRVHTSATGTLVARLASGASEARIGVSSDARALATCTEAGPSETTLEPLTTDGTTWQVFTFEELGTENERRVTSYRREHEAQCFAIEVFEPLAPPAEPPADLMLIVRSFVFAR